MHKADYTITSEGQVQSECLAGANSREEHLPRNRDERNLAAFRSGNALNQIAKSPGPGMRERDRDPCVVEVAANNTHDRIR